MTITRTILTACVLHNICIMNGDELDEVLLDDHVQQPAQDIVNLQDFNENDIELGAQKRLGIARRLMARH